MLASMEPSTSSCAASSAVLSDTGCGYGGSSSRMPMCTAAQHRAACQQLFVHKELTGFSEAKGLAAERQRLAIAVIKFNMTLRTAYQCTRSALRTFVWSIRIDLCMAQLLRVHALGSVLMREDGCRSACIAVLSAVLETMKGLCWLHVSVSPTWAGGRTRHEAGHPWVCRRTAGCAGKGSERVLQRVPARHPRPERCILGVEQLT